MYSIDDYLNSFFNYSGEPATIKKSIFYTQGFFKNWDGIVMSRSNEIKTKIKGNYSIEQLNSLLPLGKKL